MQKRTHMCGTLRKEHVKQQVSLRGWVHRRRDHGGVVFVDLRDHTGLVQVVFNPEDDPMAHGEAHTIRSEYVLAVEGYVRDRPEGTVNESLPTGEIEVVAKVLDVLNPSETPPFVLEDETDAGEDLRLRYRYLDIRRAPLQRNLRTRHEICLAVRNYFDQMGFIEVETPMLTKSTPEGARDYLVPSRVNPGRFYALPQAPQMFKQILMVGAVDRYYQIVKCFRDEDLRADRQPEFTQIDVEMSFVDEDDVLAVSEGMIKTIIKTVRGTEIETPLRRITYREAIDRYGSDKPDTRFGLELVDVSDLAAESEFRVFRNVLENGGKVKGIRAPGLATLSRKELDDLTEFVKIYGAKGLAWLKVTAEGIESPIAKFFDAGVLERIGERLDGSEGDLLVFVADSPTVVADALGNLRLKLARDLGLVPEDTIDLLWVVEFPLLVETEGQPTPVHHPFTSPHPDDVGLLESEPLTVRARAYDMVFNGTEIGGGSIRIHQRKLQQKMFRLLNISETEAQQKFGFLLNALEYGAPPHGGIAFGLDRIVTLLVGGTSIREAIAFPKTQKAVCPLTSAPAAVDDGQLRELGIQLLPEVRT